MRLQSQRKIALEDGQGTGSSSQILNCLSELREKINEIEGKVKVAHKRIDIEIADEIRDNEVLKDRGSEHLKLLEAMIRNKNPMELFSFLLKK